MKNIFTACIAAMVISLFFVSFQGAFALSEGSTVNSVQIKDADNNPSWIPAIGQKVVSIFYTDPDVADQNDPFADLLKAQNFDESKYKGVGIANLDDTWKPNALIRVIIRRKIAKYKATILTDVDKSLQKAWGLGNCDDKSVVIIIGKDKKVYYMKKGAMNEAEKQKALGIINDLLKK